MKLLQICNVSSITGGTFGCAYSIAKSLPDWNHEVRAINCGRGNPPRESADLFPGKIVVEPGPVSSTYVEESDPDMIIFHNTHIASIPPHVDRKIAKIYYQHSAFGGAVAARRKADIHFVVSKWLADKANVDDSLILHQPCPVPKKHEGIERSTSGKVVIGRICTPEKKKWPENNSIGLCEFIDENLGGIGEGIHWEFVGCPAELQARAENSLKSCSFIPASYEARSRMHLWDMMVYHNPSVPESYGRTVCEAQRCSVVPVVTDQAGFQCQIYNGFDGFLCAEHEDFVNAIRPLLKHPTTLTAMQSNAKSAGDLRGSLSRFRDSLLNYYLSIKEVKA